MAGNPLSPCPALAWGEGQGEGRPLAPTPRSSDGRDRWESDSARTTDSRQNIDAIDPSPTSRRLATLTRYVRCRGMRTKRTGGRWSNKGRRKTRIVRLRAPTHALAN